MNQDTELLEAFNFLGTNGIAQVCGVTYHAAYKWLKKGRWPRTEYTGETDYVTRIAAACREKDPSSQLTRESLLGQGSQAAA